MQTAVAENRRDVGCVCGDFTDGGNDHLPHHFQVSAPSTASPPSIPEASYHKPQLCRAAVVKPHSRLNCNVDMGVRSIRSSTENYRNPRGCDTLKLQGRYSNGCIADILPVIDGLLFGLEAAKTHYESCGSRSGSSPKAEIHSGRMAK
jgi:hypothetical protein